MTPLLLLGIGLSMSTADAQGRKSEVATNCEMMRHRIQVFYKVKPLFHILNSHLANRLKVYYSFLKKTFHFSIYAIFVSYIRLFSNVKRKLYELHTLTSTPSFSQPKE